MNENEFDIKLRRVGRIFAGYDDVIIKGYCELWGEINQHFSAFDVPIEDGILNLTFDWKKYLKAREREYSFSCLSLDEASKCYKDYEPDWHDVEINCKVKCKSKKIKYRPEYISNFLHHMFFITNLCAPGSFNLSDVKIKDEHLLLNGDHYESAWLEALDNDWPKISVIPFEKVYKWFQKLNIHSTPVARNRIERAIFALLSFSKGSDMDPANLLWLTHALESLYDTPNVGITKTLRDRIFLFLGQPKIKKEKIRKSINDFYNLRSEFVHGSLGIFNPSNVLWLYDDDKLKKTTERIYTNIFFTLTIILATFQKMVLNDWNVLNFKEEVYGDAD